MTKQNLIERVYRQHGLANGLTKKLISEIVDGVFHELGDYFVSTEMGDKSSVRFTYPGFGTFSKKRRPARTLRHPRTGVQIDVPEQKTVSFSVGADLKSLLNT